MRLETKITPENFGLGFKIVKLTQKFDHEYLFSLQITWLHIKLFILEE
jgi:hypothetical protein